MRYLKALVPKCSIQTKTIHGIDIFILFLFLFLFIVFLWQI